VEPDGRFYPLELSDKGPDGIAPFAKHPAYAVVLAAADKVGGVTAMVLLPYWGRSRPPPSPPPWPVSWTRPSAVRRSGRWASPLLFDGFLVMGPWLPPSWLLPPCSLYGRSPAATWRGPRPWRPCLLAAVLLRTKAALLAVALAGALGVIVLRDSRHVAVGSVLGVAALGAVAAGRVLEWPGPNPAPPRSVCAARRNSIPASNGTGTLQLSPREPSREDTRRKR
jgi:hypothetical protein